MTGIDNLRYNVVLNLKRFHSLVPFSSLVLLLFFK